MSTRSQPATPAGVIKLEGSDQMIVLFRVAGRAVERIRSRTGSLRRVVEAELRRAAETACVETLARAAMSFSVTRILDHPSNGDGPVEITPATIYRSIKMTGIASPQRACIPAPTPTRAPTRNPLPRRGWLSSTSRSRGRRGKGRANAPPLAGHKVTGSQGHTETGQRKPALSV